MFSGLETKQPANQVDPDVEPGNRSDSPDSHAQPVQPSDQMGFLLGFQDQALEHEFRTQFVVSQLKHIRIAIVAAIILMVGFGLLDTLLYGDETNQLRIWSARLLIFTPMAIIFIIFTYSDRYIKSAQMSGSWTAALVGTVWLILISDDGLHRSLFLMPNPVESAVYSLFLIGLTLKFSVFLTSFLCFLYAIILFHYNLPIRMNVAIVFSLVVIIGLLVLCAYQRETVARTLFIKNKEEQQAARQNIRENQRDLEWLRGLAAFLRHEVRQPVALVSSSLDIMQLHQPSKDIAHQISNAEIGVRHVWSLIDRATRATDVEAFVRQSQAQRTDAGALVNRLVGEFRQTYSGVRFAFEEPLGDSIMLHIDPDLFKEAVGNLLNNAASFAEDGSEVKVAIAKDADAVVTTIYNKGPIIEDDIESLFSPFRSTRTAENEHQGLGLYLVRLVAQHYGGTASLKNLDDQGGVVTSISLPTRTPVKARFTRSKDHLEAARL